jgi:hypothetical protein
MADKKISQLTASTTPLAGTEILPIVQGGATKQVSVANLTTGRAISVSGLTNTALTSGRITYATTGGQLTDNAGLTYGTDRVTVTHAGATRLQLTNSTDSNNVQLTAGATNSSLNSINGYQWEVQTASSTKLTIDNSSNVTVNLGNLVIGTAGKGIDFSADPSAAGMTSELLDDYEEGTWTPVLVGATTAGTQTYTWQNGIYTKTGNRVFCSFEININVKDAATVGNLRVTGLPFVSNANSGIPQGSVAFSSNCTLSSGYTYVAGNVKNGDSYVSLLQYGSGVVTFLNPPNFGNGTQFFATFSYYV